MPDLNFAVIALVWFVCGVIGAVIGNAKMAPAQGALLGLLFGPLGLLVAFAVDGRPMCGNCGGRVNGHVRVCQHCGAPNARAVDERTEHLFHANSGPLTRTEQAREDVETERQRLREASEELTARREKRNAEQKRRELREIARQHEAAEQRRKRRG